MAAERNLATVGPTRYVLVVFDSPKPQGRKRVRVRVGKATFYPEKKDIQASDRIRQAWLQQYPHPQYQPIQRDKPILLGLHIFLQCPTSLSIRRRKALFGKPVIAGRADFDRYLNQVMDALQGFAYVNDKQVSGMLPCSRQYALNEAGEDMSPQLLIIIQEES